MINKIIEAYDEFLNLLIAEIDEIVPLAVLHGWKTSRYEQGKKCRSKIVELKEIISLRRITSNSQEHSQSFLGFLHNHPNLESKILLDPDHVIVDKQDWEIVRKNVNPFLEDNCNVRFEKERKSNIHCMNKMCDHQGDIRFTANCDKESENDCDKESENGSAHLTCKYYLPDEEKA